jgi:nitrite reductase/ring-hydroxylating ferredoxin subunit
LQQHKEKNGCAGCSTRREFLHNSLMLALAALPVFAIEGTAAASERRYAIPSADSVNIDRQAQVILVRFQNNVFAFALACPHENAAVKWLPKDHRFQCSKHDSQYQPDGIHTSGRATRNLDRFAIRREDPSVVVDLQHWFQSDKDNAGWTAAAIRL